MKIPIRIAQIGIGSTVDVSASGVAFFIDTTLELGSAIDFALQVEESGGPLELVCGGKVVRVERRGSSLFTAATIENLAVRKASSH